MTVATFFGSSANINSATINLPGSIVANDIGFLFDVSINIGSYPTSVIPSGWTQLGSTQSVNDGTNYLRFNMSYKVLVGTETTLIGMNGGAIRDKATAVFRCQGCTWGAPASITQAVGLTISNQTVNPGTGEAGFIVAYGDDFNSGGSTALSMSPAGTYVDSGVQRIGYLIYDSAPASNTLTSGASVGGAMGGVWIPYSYLFPQIIL